MSSNLTEFLNKLIEEHEEYINARSVENMGFCSDSSFYGILADEETNIPTQIVGNSKIFKTKDFVDFAKKCYVRGKR